MALLTSLSAADQALFDTIVHRAEDYAFDALAEGAGVRRLGSVPTKYWRKALQHVLWGPRGAPANTFAFVREALRGFDKTYQVEFDTAWPLTKVTWMSGGQGGGFRQVDLFRLWEINGKIFFSVSVVGALFAPEPWAAINMCPVPTPYWKGANWALEFPGVVAPNVGYIKKLPFVYREYDGEYRLFVADDLDPVPPTFMQKLYLWAASVGTTDAAGWFSWPFIDDGNNADLNSGYAPNNIGPGTAVAWAAVEDCTLRELRVSADYGMVPARGGAHAVTLQKNGIDTALTCSVGAGATQAQDLANTVAVVKGDQLRIKVVSDNNVTKGLRWPRFSVVADRPAQEPKGGAVLPGADVKGDQAIGPYPIYLSDDTLDTWASALRPLVAAGVQVLAKQFGFKAPW